MLCVVVIVCVIVFLRCCVGFCCCCCGFVLNYVCVCAWIAVDGDVLFVCVSVLLSLLLCF